MFVRKNSFFYLLHIFKLCGCALLICGCLYEKNTSPLDYLPNLAKIELPKPRLDREGSLMQAVASRRSVREFDAQKELTLQSLSEILWVAYGVNRPNQKRTIPTPRNNKELMLFVSTKFGVYYYDAENHKLERVLQEDLRVTSNFENILSDIVLIYAFNVEFMRERIKGDVKRHGGSLGQLKKLAPEYFSFIYSSLTSFGSIQNVYLYCATEGLGAVLKAHIPSQLISDKLGLEENVLVLSIQHVGYPAQ